MNALQSGTQYELNYTVTFNTPAVISMYFDGYGNVPGAAHPSQFLRAVTIDAKKQEAVPLSALVISVSVPHVMGDHIEIYLTFKELKDYQTDNLLWKEIVR